MEGDKIVKVSPNLGLFRSMISVRILETDQVRFGGKHYQLVWEHLKCVSSFNVEMLGRQLNILTGGKMRNQDRKQKFRSHWCAE